MKYTNAGKQLPKELVELEKRNAHIYTKHLEGVSNRRLSQIYNLSESSVRRIILKQKGYYEEMKERINNVLAYYGLSSEGIKQIYDTAWQVGEEYILKVYDNFDMMKRNLGILHALEKKNIPVGRIVITEANEQYVSEEDKYYFLSEKLRGNNIVDLSASDKLSALMGEIIADLHLAFKECEKEEDYWNNSLLGEMNGWIRENFETSGWKYVSKELFESVVNSLAQYYDELPVQLIHRDVHFGNFLFDKGKFSGYIDFDLSQRNIRIFDLCYFLLGLLSEEEKLRLEVEQWFEFVEGVFAGYEQKVKLSDAEKAAIPYVMECIELLFVAYFAGINDTVCAEDAMKIFEFVRAQEDNIRRNI